MNRTEVHPIEVAIVAALVVVESLLVLVMAGVALLLTLVSRAKGPLLAPDMAEPEPIKYPSSTRQVAQPQLHPLALLAADLEALPAVTLRSLANVRSKRHTKRQLIELIACS